MKVSMREIVLEVLEKYENEQWNLASEAAREIIADEVTDLVKQRYDVIDTRQTWSQNQMWMDENGYPGKDDQGCDKN